MPMHSWAATLLSSVLLFLAVAQAETQQHHHPDFSGTWKQNNEKSEVPRRSSVASYVNKIAWHEPDLHVTTITEGSRGEFAYSRVFTVDGKTREGHNWSGADKQTMVRWDGETLVFETFEDERHTTEVWRLSDGGRTLTKTLQKGKTQQVYVLEKQ